MKIRSVLSAVHAEADFNLGPSVRTLRAIRRPEQVQQTEAPYWVLLGASTVLGSRIVKVDPRPGAL